MYTVDDFAKDMHADVWAIRGRLLEITSKCLQWGELSVKHLKLKDAKVVGNVLFLRFVASNDYLAIDPVEKRIYQANYDLKEVPGKHEIDLSIINNISKELKTRYSKASPVSF
ncbi:MAG: hypothetical protein UX08_C0007G0046 [Candidatus Collierbacteria bacterium GW2011_GWB1_45_35]|uniref:Uncharacterized protein n=2 Tax=Candidatus Collieribacteriota TaxID=1752725 RepID=A0A0G1KPY1_9BACT|nr:MAG: hypothetical protein UW48_C0001G0064 [Microgenomates group bacterium GW2011_GWC1_44_23]KKT85701.1 MAG: hypothetical protein UW84_C0024G0024 [Candidatus Collierbacteria bacterium GW2011_GWA2_44_99]KKT96184.1 MAG: hypothetical protein UW96_C0001G0062 [Candidatus Collierbacteria bacterium GW2011_GWA1_45_15]KKU01224.1 MAG: hypothetical protein UX01_C0001G0068 [Candidatus Collierbacteria bacterium GW2011_GWB2_45_17]KKU05349.1 MAG: hypothetical protein UX08_C0007G0046 [Candidatus Collierbacte